MTSSKKKSKIKRSVIFPIIMLAYLAAMAWIGRDRLERGEYLYYFGIIGIGLVIIVHWHRAGDHCPALPLPAQERGAATTPRGRTIRHLQRR